MNTRVMKTIFLKVRWSSLLFILIGLFVCMTLSYAKKNTKGTRTQERIAILELKNNAPSKITDGEIDLREVT